METVTDYELIEAYLKAPDGRRPLLDEPGGDLVRLAGV